MKLSIKQLEFLEAFTPCPGYEHKLPLMCIHNMPERIWFTFHSESQAYAWVRNLEDRGLVTIEKQCFARITEAGIAARKRTTQPKPQPRGSNES